MFSTTTDKKAECTIVVVRIFLHESRFIPPRWYKPTLTMVRWSSLSFRLVFQWMLPSFEVENRILASSLFQLAFTVVIFITLLDSFIDVSM